MSGREFIQNTYGKSHLLLDNINKIYIHKLKRTIITTVTVQTKWDKF